MERRKYYVSALEYIFGGTVDDAVKKHNIKSDDFLLLVVRSSHMSEKKDISQRKKIFIFFVVDEGRDLQTIRITCYKLCKKIERELIYVC